ncbi:unnamed protein product [Parascedosporium putredinis]|uniref:Uncharacterized protein n=1 Tax=Parascedosporium putredinis TaxID=1442378 RepID=A0A9P1H0G5_9PEZI|nr:unnamed protein product [Parascedosporium putredinis]CAI7991745.1 unnamed protein product [Parascedosporium putredinis]
MTCQTTHPACSLAAGSIFTVEEDADADADADTNDDDDDDASEAASRKPSLSHQSLSRHRPCSCALSDAPSAPSLTTYPSYSSTASSAAASQRARRIMSQPKPEKRGLGRAIADYIKPPRD